MKEVYLDLETRSIADLVEVSGDLQYHLGEGLTGTIWMITRINVPASARGTGTGSKLLRRILDDADEEGVVLVLGVSPSGGLGARELRQWYSRYGFQHLRESPLMVRYPKTGG